MKKFATAIIVLSTLSGCASVMNDSNQAVKIDTRAATGEVVAGADCTVSGPDGQVKGRSGETLSIRRSGDDLDVSCTHPENDPANGRMISRANGGLAGNIIFGGVVGAIIDHSKGTAYTYPTWIEMVFGETKVYDRGDEKEGTPLAGRLPGEAAKRIENSPGVFDVD